MNGTVYFAPKPEVVRAYKERLAATERELGALIASCRGVPGALVAAWSAMSAAMRAFERQAPSIVDAAAQARIATEYARSLEGWQKLVESWGCRTAGEILVGGFVALPSDVRELKDALNPSVQALDADVRACAALDDGTRAAWKTFKDAWDKWFAADESFWRSGQQMDRTEQYAKEIRAWQDKIAGSRCRMSAPPIDPNKPSLFGGAGAGGDLEGTIKTVAIAGAFVAGVVALRTVMR